MRRQSHFLGNRPDPRQLLRRQALKELHAFECDHLLDHIQFRHIPLDRLLTRAAPKPSRDREGASTLMPPTSLPPTAPPRSLPPAILPPPDESPAPSRRPSTMGRANGSGPESRPQPSGSPLRTTPCRAPGCAPARPAAEAESS